MRSTRYLKEPVLVIGHAPTAYSLVVCLLQANHPVTLCTEEESKAEKAIKTHWDDLCQFHSSKIPELFRFETISQLGQPREEKIVIAITDEDILLKRNTIQSVEKLLPSDAIITINSESIPLNELQKGTLHPQRIIGANWVEPVHTTLFLEIITNQWTDDIYTRKLSSIAKKYWRKDPYLLTTGLGIRARMMCAMIREAFHLVKEGYVTLQDVDRACRNDPGYYFPFAGNFRYMDLMGGYLYGVVMKDLNPDLAKDREVPDFFNKIIEQEHYGMESGRGFYEYEEGEVENWHALFQKFSYQIRDIIDKYPFNYLEEEIPAKTK